MRRVDGGDHCRRSGRGRERGHELVAVAAPDPVGPARGRRRPEGSGGGVDVGRQPRQGGLAAADPLVDRLAQGVEPLAGARRDGQHGDAGRQQRPQVVARRGRSATQQVDLVEHDEHRRGVAGERAQVALVQRRVGVLLGIGDPHQEVDEADEPVDLEPVRDLDRVEVREVEQDQAVGRTGREGVARADL
jgi:hypothetical protein